MNTEDYRALAERLMDYAAGLAGQGLSRHLDIAAVAYAIDDLARRLADEQNALKAFMVEAAKQLTEARAERDQWSAEADKALDLLSEQVLRAEVAERQVAELRRALGNIEEHAHDICGGGNDPYGCWGCFARQALAATTADAD